jgi:hypothetical protein
MSKTMSVITVVLTALVALALALVYVLGRDRGIRQEEQQELRRKAMARDVTDTMVNLSELPSPQASYANMIRDREGVA